MKRLIFLCLLLVISTGLSAQKVKYKDLYVLLSANDFLQAEPFLRTFINGESDHANANLYMGKLFEYKYRQLDVLKDTGLFTAYCDSAVYYYRQAYTFVNEKEVKKNDEYYQDYSRRDLRTGKFGVKLADVKFDLEKRIGDTEKLSNNVKSLKTHFENAVNAYSGAESTYRNVTDKFKSMTGLLLKSASADIDSLKKIEEDYSEFIKGFQNYKQAQNLVPGSEYNQRLVVKILAGLTKVNSPDFYANEVSVYDFKSWSDETSKAIIEVIGPMKENMAEYDRQLDDLHRQVTEDSMIVENELAALTEKMLFEQLTNYDSEPLPSILFNFKVDEITYHSHVNQHRKEGKLDSANIGLQLEVYDDLQEKFNLVDKSYHELAKINVVEKSDLYSEFVSERFGSVPDLVNYIAGKGEIVSNEKHELQTKLSEMAEKSRWGIMPNDTIPIPLFLTDTSQLFPSDGQSVYKTLKMDSINGGFQVFGIKLDDGKPKKYISEVGFDRMVDTLFLQPLKTKVAIDSTSVIEAWSKSYKDKSGFIYIIRISGDPNAGFEMINYEPESGIKWATPFENFATIKEINVDADTGLIVVKMGQITENGPGDETENLVFNFKGALMTTLGN